MDHVIILAAGQSKRMKSETSKVFHTLAGKPLITHVVESVQSLISTQPIVVIAPSMAQSPLLKGCTPVIQHTPLGTGHAVQTAITYVPENAQDIYIVCGDTPLIRPETLNHLKETKGDVVLVSMPLSDPTKSYGRLVIDARGQVTKIVEMKEATQAEQILPFANSGVYKIRYTVLKELLTCLSNNNVAKEYYLTDIVELAYNKQLTVMHVQATEEEFLGVNTRQDLAAAHAVFQNRKRDEMMAAGVTLIQPETIHFSADTLIDKDVTVGPFVCFGKNVRIESGVTILPFSHLEETTIRAGAKVGPFARCRGNTLLEENAEIGNFVEVKGSTIGKKSKVKHLSYIGDSTLGMAVNVGAGAITCNYDGYKKARTTVNNNAFVGANATLIAPVTIGEQAIVAAGSTISTSVEQGALAIARSVQVDKKEWAAGFHKKNKNK